MARPMLGEIELHHVQQIEVDGDQILVQHGVPALEGDFLQGLGRRARRVTLSGMMVGPEASENLKTLRAAFRAAAPVSFVADITTATRVGQVLIEELGVRDLAGKPERFEYALTLREYQAAEAVEEEAQQDEEVATEASSDAEQQTDEQITRIAARTGSLLVRVNLTGSKKDYSAIVVVVEGTTENGEHQSLVMEEQENGVYRRDNIPTGEYIIRLYRK